MGLWTAERMDCIDPQLTANERTTLGLVAPTKQEAIDRMYPGRVRLNVEMDRLRGWPAPQRRDFLPGYARPGL